MTASSDSTSAAATAGIGAKLRTQLSLMMFLEYTIWGAWAPILALHLNQLSDFQETTRFLGLAFSTDTKINLVYMTMAIASILSPFIAGQIADRYFSTERFLAFSQFVGGILLIVIATLDSFAAVFWAMLAYTILYSPTIALTNSLSFHHLPNGEKDFGGIRMFGTLGWIAVGWAFGLYLRGTGADVGHCLVLAGVLSFLMAAYSLTLPHTPPPENPTDPWAFMAALRLLKNRSFAILVVVSFLVATELQFYYVLSPLYFNQGGGPYDQKAILKTLAEDDEPLPEQIEAVARLFTAAGVAPDKKISVAQLREHQADHEVARQYVSAVDDIVVEKGGVRLQEGDVPIVMTFGQICEMLVLLALPLFLKKFGFRLTIALGIATWSVRYFIFAWCPSPEIVIASQLLHGFGFAFFFVGGFIYGDRIATPDIKASVQALLLLVTMGAGMLVSSLIAGPISDLFERNWHNVFLVPAILTAICTALFLIGFRDDAAAPSEAP